MALSIDGSDVRALYNWGLALSWLSSTFPENFKTLGAYSFLALSIDGSDEAASDADKVYLAAIDKFNAMMSRNKAYAPDALFRWGVALQQRSRLRPSNAKEKMKLLHQAKSLFEDALCMDSNNVQVREALSSCLSELKYRRF
ncbi:Tetratricopeptide-like helical [Thalictrum thalictroides]|uniref:Tetratricopeptide-like helical n=1 Tax=Thalictrum thalictroides TaxID=46969 RepID=A0A7J6V9S8_THATH|nr:Tetratricopeptide-like helical [Thalictrum thalictroides]